MAVIIMDQCAMGAEPIPGSNGEAFNIIFEDQNVVGLRFVVPMEKSQIKEFANYLSKKASGLYVASADQMPLEPQPRKGPDDVPA